MRVSTPLHDSSAERFVPVVILLSCVAIVKLLIVWQLADHPMVQPDTGLDPTAHDLARRVVAGDWRLGPGLYYVSPIYIYVLAAGLAVTDSFTAVSVLQVVGSVRAGGDSLNAGTEVHGFTPRQARGDLSLSKVSPGHAARAEARALHKKKRPRASSPGPVCVSGGAKAHALRV